MARPQKNNAEYFTHDADMRNDLRIKALRRNFGHKGFAVWNFMLETLTDCDYFEIEYTEINIELLAADFDVSTEELRAIIDYCRTIGLFQIEDGMLFSETHKKRFKALLNNRERKRISDIPAEETSEPDNSSDDMADETAPELEQNEGSGAPKHNSRVKERKGEKRRKENYPIAEIVALWNETCKTLPAVEKITQGRKEKIISRLAEFGNEEDWLPTAKNIFETINRSKFLLGKVKSWKATFDWVFANPSNWVRIIEGNYMTGDNAGEGEAAPGGIRANLGFDERIDATGRRTYGTGKATVPAEAPPRPTARHGWSAEKQSWVYLG